MGVLMNKHSTPILAAVQRMRADDNARHGVDPYNTLLRTKREPGVSPAQVSEANQILKCFETVLEVQS